MHEGKLTNEQLEKLIFDKLDITRQETITGPGIGKDCAVLDFDDNYMVVSSDPITGTEKNIGKLCVNICLNDIAAAGAEPVAIMVTCLIPPKAKMEEIKEVLDDLIKACKENGVDLIGGHTEISSAVNRFVLNGTALGKKNKTSEGDVKDGFELIMSKSAGLEGVGIIASEKSDEIIKKLGKDVYSEALSYLDMISVVKEGKIGRENGAVIMHDATEGGILGGAWEMAQFINMGVEIYLDNIPISEATRKICNLYDIDPLRLISSGVMLFAASPEASLAKKLSCHGIEATVIGRFTDKKDKIMITDGEHYVLTPPKSDEMYSVLGLKKDSVYES